MDDYDFKEALHDAIAAKMNVPEPYQLIVETDVGSTLALLRDPNTGANRYGVDLGVVGDNQIEAAAQRAATELTSQLEDVPKAT